VQRKKSALRRGFIVLVVLFVLVSAQPFSFTSPVVAQEPDDVPTSGSALSKDAGLFRTHVTFQDAVTQAKLKDYGVSKTGAPTPTFTPTPTCTPTPTPTPTSIPASTPTPTPTPTSTPTSTSTPECASPTPSATIIALPDLVVQSMDAQPEFLKINQPVTITVTLRNQGNGEIDRFSSYLTVYEK